ncbi:unnamed protein product [Absidia cylindrospora]
MGGEKKETLCENHTCSIWKQCAQVWQISMIWIAVTTITSFLVNCVFIYCLHHARREQPNVKGKSKAAPTSAHDDQYKMRQSYPDRSPSFFDYNRPPRLAPLNPHHSPYEYINPQTNFIKHI